MVYDYFDPAFRAGGPISSCANLVALLEGDVPIQVFTSNRDLDGSKLDVVADQWQPYGRSTILYAERDWSAWRFGSVLRTHGSGVVFLNGVYSFVGVVVPLLLAFLRLVRVKLIISPRGMLQAGSLSIKPLKKRLYLALFRRLVKGSNVAWHIASQAEHDDLLKQVPSAAVQVVRLIGNVPRTDLLERPIKTRGNISRFTTIALVSPMKNILGVIRALKHLGAAAEYHIHGPVKDTAYWEECQREIARLPPNITVQHFGPVTRSGIQQMLEATDFYIQPSVSENFGHSIFESLMVGVPVITSTTTPWNGIGCSEAGFVVDPHDEDQLVRAIEKALRLPQPVYEQFCRNARQVAEKYLQTGDFRTRYLELLNAVCLDKESSTCER